MTGIGGLGEFEQILLLALIRLRERAYGVTIRQEIQERIGKNVAIGAVYTTLQRLERKGFVSSKLGEATPERGGRPKRFYNIEAPGISALDDTQKRISRMWHGVALPKGA